MLSDLLHCTVQPLGPVSWRKAELCFTLKLPLARAGLGIVVSLVCWCFPCSVTEFLPWALRSQNNTSLLLVCMCQMAVQSTWLIWSLTRVFTWVGGPSRPSNFLLWDFNAHIGNDSVTWLGLQNLNLSGVYFFDFCANHSLSVTPCLSTMVFKTVSPGHPRSQVKY